jgi:hypothetical protein
MNKNFRLGISKETNEGDLVRFEFFLPRDKIGLSHFILEGHDGLGVQTTEPGSDKVTWIVLKCVRNEAFDLLNHLLEEISDLN